MKINSFYDTKGKLWIACSECDRGGNGSDKDKDKCSCGHKVRKFNGLGCFGGNLMDKYNDELKAV